MSISPRDRRPFVTVFASGKGGVGKTAVVANMAVALACQQRQVMVLDADFGLANLDLALGLNPTHTLEHVIAGRCGLERIAVRGPRGITVLPAGSGTTELTALPDAVLSSLLKSVVDLAQEHDHLLVDSAAGVSENVVGLFRAAHRLVVVLSPDPTSLVDAYATIKLAYRRGFDGEIGIVVNGASGVVEAERIYERLRRASCRFLQEEPVLFGSVPRDAHVEWSIRAQRVVVDAYPDCPAAVAFRRLAARLDDVGLPAAPHRSPAWPVLPATESVQ